MISGWGRRDFGGAVWQASVNGSWRPRIVRPGDLWSASTSMCNMRRMSNIMLPLPRWKFSYQLRRALSTCGAKCFRLPLGKFVSCGRLQQIRVLSENEKNEWPKEESRGVQYYWRLSSLLTHGRGTIYEAFPSETHCKNLLQIYLCHQRNRWDLYRKI